MPPKYPQAIDSARQAAPIPGPNRWEKVRAKETSPHHVLSVAYKPRHPIHVLARAQGKVDLDVIKEMERVPTEGFNTSAR